LVFQRPASCTSTTTINGNRATTTTAPSNVQTSAAEFTAQLIAIGQTPDATRVAWQAQLETMATGWLFVSKKGDAKGAVRAIIRALTEDGHIQPD
jgi:hypothetical protein